MILSKIRQYIGLETDEEKLERFNELEKSFAESDKVLDELAKDFFIEKSLNEQRLSDPDNYIIQDKIVQKYDLFIKAHKESIGKAKRQYDKLKKEKDELEKSLIKHKSILGESGNNFLDIIDRALESSKETVKFYVDKYNGWNKGSYRIPSEGSVLEFFQNNYEDSADNSKDNEVLREAVLRELKNQSPYSKIKKAYQDHKISLDSFNTIIKGLTKEEKTKYADFLLFNEKGELLLLQRSKWEDPNKGAWVLPGGHVDPGEDFETAAKRELVEESGFWIDECENVGSYEDDKCRIEYYQATINTNEKQPVLQWEEARDYKWVPYNEIKDETMIFNMQDNVMRILGLVNRHKEIIKKAILQGIIPLEQVVEKAKKGNIGEIRIWAGKKVQKQLDKTWKELKDIDNNKSNQPFKKEKDYAERVIKGIDSLKRLSPAEEQGRLLGGKRNVEASIIAGASQTTGEEYQRGDSREEQEVRLKQYAQQEGIWVEDYKLKYGKGNYLDKGGEAEVFYDSNEGNVYKIHHFPFEQEPLKLFDRVAVHNVLFPESSYEVVGFTHKDVYGEDVFAVILKQPFVTKTSHVVTQKEVDEEMDKRGFVETEGMYLNEDYAIGDLHPGNIFKSSKGNYIFIDALIDINTPEAGYGGTRELGDIKVPTERSIDPIIRKAILERLINPRSFIEKAWKKSDIGTVVNRKDGQTYRKISDTGDQKRDWKLVTKQKEAKPGENPVNKELKKESKPNPQFKEEDLKNNAQTTSETALQTAIKNSPDPKVRQTAHEELDRREKEEKPQEEEKEGKELEEIDNDLKKLEDIKLNLLKKVEELSKLKEKLYSNMNIESPKSEDEKKLDKEISDIFSEVNSIVIKKRKIIKETEDKSIKKSYEQWL